MSETSKLGAWRMGQDQPASVTPAADGPTDRFADAWPATPIGRVAAPLRDQVLDLVRQGILDFKLRPGQRLIERELMAQLGVSRATVREVVARLASEGLVTIIPQRGAIVSVLSVAEAADIYEMRVALEALAVRHFVDRASDAQVAQLRQALELLVAVESNGSDNLERLRAKDSFYRVIFEGAASPPLTQILTSLQSRVRLLRQTSLSVPGRAEEVVDELRQIVEAVEAREAEKAALACSVHVRNAAAAGLARMAEAGAD
jgi:DNA-binding GntR family transcriptional regulator